jgi:uncharacterized protein YcnI
MLDILAPGTRARTALMRGMLSAGLLGLLAAPVQASVNIPEGGAVPPDSVFVIHFQVFEGCDGAPTDALEVTIPDGVRNPLPQGVPGWETEIDTTVEGEDAERTVVRWTGGLVEPDEYIEFGLRARFPDEPDATLAFPVVQTCGTVQTELTGDEAPTVTLSPRVGPRGIIELDETVAQLSSDVEELDGRLAGVDPVNLRSRVSDLEDAVGQLEETVEQLTQAVEELQDPVEADGS